MREAFVVRNTTIVADNSVAISVRLIGATLDCEQGGWELVVTLQRARGDI